MRVRFWGTRGSLAKPGPTTLRYGGNTSCIEVRTADGTLVVLDCGTGAHGLGLALAAESQQPIHGHLLITHTHWDHIQGFPFFAPLFVAGNEWDIYAPGGLGQHMEATLSGQMEYTYFPVTLEQLGATIRFHDLVEGTFDLGSIRVSTRYLNHPALALGYRLEAGGATVIYAVDHEPHARPVSQVPGANGVAPASPLVHLEEQRHVQFLADADLVIHDAQYTADEYPRKIGWGHSTVEYAVDVALAARAKRLALFHHDPLRDDEALDQVVEACRHRVAALGDELEVFGAAEGEVIELPEQQGTGQHEMGYPERLAPRAIAMASGVKTLLVVEDQPDAVHLLTTALRPEGFRLISAADSFSALRLARAERPDLILLDLQLAGPGGLDVCRALRADADAQLRGVPLVLLTSRMDSDDTAAGFAAGATDYLVKPFTPAYVRSRVRGWLLRSGAAGSV